MPTEIFKTNKKTKSKLVFSKPKNKVEKEIAIHLPLFLDPVQAGFPSPAQDFVDKELDLNEYLIKHPAATFFVRVIGSSMIEANIFPGDILIVDRALNAENNKIILGVLNGEFTVKRLVKQGTKTFLKPENPKFKTIEINEENEFEIWGIVTNIIHEAK